MTFELLVDGPEFAKRLIEDIEDASQRAWIACLSFEGDEAGRSIADALLGREGLDRRVLADALFTSAMINDRFLYRPGNLFDDALWDERQATEAMLEELVHQGVDVRVSHPPGPLFSRFLQRGHKKLLIVDDAAYVGGINLSEHNFRWHDLMVRIEDPALVDVLERDFEHTWEGKPRAQTQKVGGHRVTTLDGSTNPRTLEALFARIRSASKQVQVVSPYLSPPFTSVIRQARAGGADVEVITPDANNWPLFRTATLDEARRHGYEIHLFPDRMNHTKALLLDGETLVVGSSNFDLFSYWLHEEVILELEDPALVDAFRTRVLEPDRKASRPPDDWPSPTTGALARMGLIGVYRAVQALAPIARRGPRVVSLKE